MRELFVDSAYIFFLSSHPGSICDRLREQGWEEEIKFVKRHRNWEFNNHKLVNQPKELTERSACDIYFCSYPPGINAVSTPVWKNIEEPMTHFMQQMRILRIHKDCRPRYNVLRKNYPEYVDLQAPDLPTPIIGDILTLDLVKDIAEIPGASENDVPDDNIFDPLLDQLPEISRTWLVAKESELVSIAQKVKPAFTTPDIKLATSIFQCTGMYCKERMSADMILKHSCATSPRFSSPGKRPEQLNAMVEEANWFNAVPWNYGGNRVRFDADGFKRVKLILHVLGLDPATTTGEELDKGNYAIECVKCKRKDKRHFMRWQKAV